MKHILPILTLASLAAVASADAQPRALAAAPAGLSYNRVTVSRQGQENSLSASALLGSSNVLASLTQTAPTKGSEGFTFSLGYVFKNVAYGTDATVSVGTGDQFINSAVSINLRRTLNEVFAGLEVAVGYSYVANSDSGYQGDAQGTTGIVTAELAYNISKTWQVAVGLTNWNPTWDRTTSVSVRHNF